MRSPVVHCTRLLSFLCGAAIFSAIAGCWEEIHYTGSDPAARREPAAGRDDGSGSPPATSPSVTASATDEVATFTDELAPSPATEESVGTVSNSPPAAADPAAGPAPAAVEPQHNTRRLAWLLGSKLSLAALKSDRGAPPDDVAKLFEQSQFLAQLLGTSASELPSPTASGEAGRSSDHGLNYLFSEGRTIGRDLAERQGDDHAALFELAVKSNVLLALYRPDAPIAGTLAGAIRQSSTRAGLPTQLWRPLLDKLDRGAPAADVHDAVFAMYADVDRYLSSPAP